MWENYIIKLILICSMIFSCSSPPLLEKGIMGIIVIVIKATSTSIDYLCFIDCNTISSKEAQTGFFMSS